MFEKIINVIKKDKKEEIEVKDKPWIKWCGKVPHTLTYFEGSIYEYLNNNKNEFEHLTALEYFKNTFSFKYLMKEIDKCSSALVKSGVKENDIVTICMANTPEAIIAFYSINKIGAIANMVHPLSSENEIKNIIVESGSKTLFINDILYKNIKNIEDDINVKTTIIAPIANSMDLVTKVLYNLTSKSKVNSNEISNKYVIWNDFINTDIIDTFIRRTKDDDAVILYSGGTTGKSKGVVLSNLCFNALTEACKYVVDTAKPGNSMLSFLPIFHGFGLAVSINAPLCLGMKCILIPKLNTSKINKVIKTKKPTILPVIPALLNVITKDNKLGSNAFSSVKEVLSGGDYLSLDLKQKAEDYFRNHGSNITIRIGYGLTECTACTSVSLIDNYKNGSIGIPFPDNYYKIVKTNTHITADYNEIGEICISGPTVMKRYLNNEEETYKTLRIHEDGKLWLHTGDLGYMDEDGVFYYSTRLKGMIISNGSNIYPGELEEIFNRHPNIDSSVVVGVNDEIKVQAVKVIIVLKNNVKLTDNLKSEIKEYAKKNIAKYALPKYYEFINELPKTKVGKVDYIKLQ